MSEVRLLFAGDVYAGDSDLHVAAEVQHLARQADLVIANLESPLTDDGEPLAVNKTLLRSSPKNIRVLRELSTDIACLANNHICDWDRRGLARTLDILAENNMLTVGAGTGVEQAQTPVVIDRQGLRLGFIACSAEEIETTSALKEGFGCWILDRDKAAESVERLKREVDVVIVMAHWGLTNYHYPLPDDVDLGRSLIDAGATLVIGHHPHVVQGIERRGNGAILYSLGNFCFVPYMRTGRLSQLSRENRRGMLSDIILSKEKVISITCRHVRQVQNDAMIELLSESRQVKRERFVAKLSAGLAHSDYAALFRRYALRRLLWRGLRWLHPRCWRNLNRSYVSAAVTSIKHICGRR